MKRTRSARALLYVGNFMLTPIRMPKLVVSIRGRKVADRGVQTIDGADAVLYPSTTTLGHENRNLDVSGLCYTHNY